MSVLSDHFFNEQPLEVLCYLIQFNASIRAAQLIEFLIAITIMDATIT